MSANEYRVPVTAEDRLRAGLAIHMVAARTGVQPEQMTARGRADTGVSRARWLAMYLAHISFGWPLERVAHVFGLNRSTASTACRWVEEARDAQPVDQLLTQLETCLHSVVEAPRQELPR
ncbi:helix-turn-helix domain-containing protein [Brevundimonas nasdae]|uniref:helix-turn-helix domain-containing protein n=1 Tax=Brevundimonas nasdae TaxID=172043 RepID=UPI003F68E7B9